MRTLRMVAAGALVWVAATGIPIGGQVNQFPPQQGPQGTQRGTGIPPTTRTGQPTLGPTTEMPSKIAIEQARSRNTERQKRLEDDTAKLLSLATELKEQVDKTNKDIMSVDVIKKAEEIEKLAKDVKDRMKG
jgi:hypothetical protein